MTDKGQTTLVKRVAAPGRASWRSDLGLILPPVAVIFGAIVSFGATGAGAALVWAAMQALCAAGLAFHAARAFRPPRLPGLQLAALAAFLGLIVWSVLTLFPLPGFPIPAAWSLVGGDGALTIDRAATLIEILKLGGLACAFIAAWLIAQDETRADRALKTVLVLGAIYAVWAIASFTAGGRTVLWVEKTYHLDRLTASFLSANSAGSLFGVLALIAWTSALRALRIHLQTSPDSRPERSLLGAAIRGAAAILFWGALLLTVSRAAMVSTLACLVLVTAVEIVEALNRARAGMGKIVGYTAPALLGMIVIFAATIGQRFIGELADLGADSSTRETIFATYLQVARTAPLAGYGLGSFPSLNLSQVTQANFDALWNLGAVHNIYLQWLIEGGVIGSSLMAAVLVFLLADIARRRVSARAGRMRATIALAATALLLIHNTVDYSIQVPAIAALWAFLLGLGASPGDSERKAGPSRRSNSVRRHRRAQHDELDGEAAGGVADAGGHQLHRLAMIPGRIVRPHLA